MVYTTQGHQLGGQLKNEERKGKEKNKNQQSNTKERGNPWLELSYSLNSPPGDTVSNRLSNYSLTTPTSVLHTIYPEGKRVPPQPSLCPSFIVGHTWSICINIALPARTCFLLTLKLRTPNKCNIMAGGFHFMPLGLG